MATTEKSLLAKQKKERKALSAKYKKIMKKIDAEDTGLQKDFLKFWKKRKKALEQYQKEDRAIVLRYDKKIGKL